MKSKPSDDVVLDTGKPVSASSELIRHSSPRTPTVASTDRTASHGSPRTLGLVQLLKDLVTTTAFTASALVARDMWSREALEQDNNFRSQAKHKDSFTTLFEEAAHRKSQIEGSSRQVHEEIEKTQSAQVSAVTALADFLGQRLDPGQSRHASGDDRQAKWTRDSIQDLRDDRDADRRDLDRIAQDKVSHEDLNKRLTGYARQRDLDEVINLKIRVIKLEDELKKAAVHDVKGGRDYTSDITQLRCTIANLERTIGKQQDKYSDLEKSVQDASGDRSSDRSRWQELELVQQRLDERWSTKDAWLGDLLQTAEKRFETSNQRIEMLETTLRSVSQEIQVMKEISKPTETSTSTEASNESPDQLIDKLTQHFRKETDQLGQVFGGALQEVTKKVNTVAEDLKKIRDDVQKGESTQKGLTDRPHVGISAAEPSESAIVTRPVPSTPSETSIILDSVHKRCVPLENWCKRAAGDIENLQLFVRGQQQSMDTLSNAVNQLYNTHPGHALGQLNRLAQSQHLFSQKLTAQMRELETSMRNAQAGDVDYLKGKIQQNTGLATQLHTQLVESQKSLHDLRSKDARDMQSLDEQMDHHKTSLSELKDWVEKVTGGIHTDLSAFRSDIETLRCAQTVSVPTPATTVDQGNAIDSDSDQPLTKRARVRANPSSNSASLMGKRPRALFSRLSSEETDDDIPSARSKKIDKTIRHMNISRTGDGQNQ